MPEYIKTKSNYVYRTEHQKTPGGTIYERNYMTVSLPDGYSKDMTPIYADSNFVFVTRSGINMRKRRRTGNWINNGCGNSYWTSVCLGDSITRETKIVFNPDYSSLKDFAYYGSAINLIQATVNGVIMKFPAELYFSDEQYQLNGTGATYYKVYNDFNIDVHSKKVNGNEVENPLRYMCLSSQKYCVMNANDEITHSALTWSVTNANSSCNDLANGTFIATASTDIGNILVYYVDGEIMLLTSNASHAGCKIRPNKDEIEHYYDNVDDFTKVLLNRNTNPLYKAVFMTPVFTDKGYIQSYQTYVWPTKGGWNPDISSQAYELYINSLIRLATYHDEYDSDNLWRMMTHEAIKNLDWTFTKQVGDEVDTIEDIDTSRIEPILKIYGRQYDDIKRYIDTIRFLNNITYDTKNNFPDYFLTDSLSISGWDVKSVAPTTDETVVADSLYSGVSTEYDSTEANIEFMRRLKLNTRYLLSTKGTRTGVESMLGLLGYEKDKDYTIKEYDYVFSGEYPTIEQIGEYNTLKSNYNYEDNPDLELFGLPLKQITVMDGTAVTLNYAIPWFENGREYDEDLYFQMYGGWRCINTETIDLPELTDATAITSDNGYTIYGQTQNSIRFAETLQEMLELGKAVVKTGDICYVANINNITDMYNQHPEEVQPEENFSHYFYLMDDNYFATLGFIEEREEQQEGGDGEQGSDDNIGGGENSGGNNANVGGGGGGGTSNNVIDNTDSGSEINGYWGWKSIGIDELSGATSNVARKTLHLESVVDTNEGNNPHFEERKDYDDGEYYVRRMANPFLGAVNAGYFDDVDESVVTAATSTCRFNATKVEDDKKCWYFTDTTNGEFDIKVVTTDNNGNYVSGGEMSALSVDVDGIYNPEGGATNDEAAANSVVNVKNMELTFKNIDTDNAEAIDFITKKVLFYVEQMVPSTTILSVVLSNS